MKNLKTLAIAATLAIGGLLTNVTPAEAGTCWNLEPGQRAQGYYCQTQRRVNANGHVVWDIIEAKGTTTLVFWDDNVVEIIGVFDRPYQTTFYTDRDGDYRIELPRGAEIAIRL